MSVYVDDMYTIPLGEYRGMKMSHLVADTTAELLDMVDKIGVKRKWIQDEGLGTEHFDICQSKRALAIKAGAIPIGMIKLSRSRLIRKSPNEKLIV